MDLEHDEKGKNDCFYHREAQRALPQIVEWKLTTNLSSHRFTPFANGPDDTPEDILARIGSGKYALSGVTVHTRTVHQVRKFSQE